MRGLLENDMGQKVTVQPKIRDALVEFVTRVGATDVPWAITGSLAHRLHGVPVEVHDIDVLTDKKGAYKIAALFTSELIGQVQFRSTEIVRSHLGKLNLRGVIVEIIGDMETRRPDGSWETPTEIGRNLQLMEFDGMRIPLMSLRHESEAYERLGRTDRARLLHDYAAAVARRKHEPAG